MATSPDDTFGKRASGSDKGASPDHVGGDQIRKAQEWGGGSKGSKGPIKLPSTATRSTITEPTPRRRHLR